MSELPGSSDQPLYVPVPGSSGQRGWGARFRLPEILPRDEVIAEIHQGVRARRYSTAIPLERMAEEGLSAILFGPKGDQDAEQVRDVFYYTDPSKTFGEREAWESDRHALRIAKLNNWTEVHLDGSTMIDGQEDQEIDDLVRAVIGRNKDRYGGNAAFTVAETAAFLPGDTRFTIEGGYHVSSRPTWDEPYHEAAVVATFQADPESYRQQDELQLFRLAKALGDQHRFTVLAPWCVEAFQSNPNAQ